MAPHDPPPRRREQILETATREFARKGYEHASLNTIIRACGMSKSSFYHFFGSKEALFETVVTEAMRELGRKIDIPAPHELAGPHFWEHLTRLVTELLESAGRESWFAEAGKLFHSPELSVEHSPALREATASVRNWLDEALRIGRECGEVRDDLPSSLQASLVFAVLRSLDDWSLHHLHEYPAEQRERIARAQLGLLHRMLAPGSEDPEDE
ncbi:TetR/AcrR family transcriptional regulator [Actinopolyspora mortivallis]|uniref:TetR/AcrR family transcriptional regulator n=1 Tax=Actinopolyspora mortivallis TaxID=33906 RepID=UPI000362FED0|nr:TetR/AcrR family transcriptional regulator [Actinopolyspora mortivallis]